MIYRHICHKHGCMIIWFCFLFHKLCSFTTLLLLLTTSCWYFHVWVNLPFNQITTENLLCHLILSSRNSQTIISVLTCSIDIPQHKCRYFNLLVKHEEKQVHLLISWQLYSETHKVLTLLSFRARGQDAQHTVCSGVWFSPFRMGVSPRLGGTCKWVFRSLSR